MRKQQLLLLLVIITALATTLFLPGLVRSEEIFIDNLDPEASCDPASTFSTSSWCSQRYLSNYHYHMANEGADTFIWDIAARGGYAAGRYDVFAYWCADPSRARSQPAKPTS